MAGESVLIAPAPISFFGRLGKQRRKDRKRANKATARAFTRSSRYLIDPPLPAFKLV